MVYQINCTPFTEAIKLAINFRAAFKKIPLPNRLADSRQQYYDVKMVILCKLICEVNGVND